MRMMFSRTDPIPEEQFWVDLRGKMTVITESIGHIEDGVLIPVTDSDRSREEMVSGDRYEPSRHPELATEFARLRSASDKEILRFCGVWGHPYEVPARVADLRREASRVWLVLEMLSAVSKNDLRRAEQLVELGLHPPRLLREGVFRHGNFWGAWIRPDFDTTGNDNRRPNPNFLPIWPALDNPDPFEAWSHTWVLSTVIQIILNESLRNTQPAVHYEWRTPEFRMEITFQSLIDVIYWHLANIAVSMGAGSANLRQCKECKTVFQVNRKDQLFCPPDNRLARSKAGRTWSRCGDRFRKREKRRAEGKEKAR